MEERALDDGSRLFISSRALMQVHELGDGIELHVCRGTVAGDLADVVIARGERQLSQHGRSIFMVDLLDSSLITPEFRDRLTTWLRDLHGRGHASVGHLLMRSKLIAAAADSVNRATGTQEM